MENEIYNSSDVKVAIKWSAPEALRFNQFTTKSDVWSFGVVLFEMITFGSVPYIGMSNSEVIDKIEGGYRMARPSICPTELYQLMSSCWDADPVKRPDFKEVSVTLRRMLQAITPDNDDIEEDKYASPSTLRESAESLYNNTEGAAAEDDYHVDGGEAKYGLNSKNRRRTATDVQNKAAVLTHDKDEPSYGMPKKAPNAGNNNNNRPKPTPRVEDGLYSGLPKKTNDKDEPVYGVKASSEQRK